MKSFFKKLSCLIIAGMICTACSCGNAGNNSQQGSGGENQPNVSVLPNYTLDEYKFSTVFIDGQEKVLEQYAETVAHEDGCVIYDINSRIGDKNYLKFDIETDVDLVGFINYYNVNNPEETNSEKFFIKANSTEFTTFLDSFRIGARGAFDKVITTISFQGVDETKEGHFTFKSLGVSDRTIELREDWRISNGDMVLGTSAFYGGCITYLEKLDQDVYEYMDFDGNIVIDRYVDPDYDAMQVVSDKVNFVNIYDLGREIQPSYYSRVESIHGYNPDYDPEATDTYYQGLGGGVLYNPIQCGDFGGHTPQIIDYVWREDYLYIIMKAQEWFFYTNIQANGYIEVTYYFDEGGAILVDNVYTDFSCFIGERDIALNAQETPATYFSYPLNYFYCETKQGLIFDNNLSEQNGRNQGKTSLKANVSSADYFYAVKGKYVINDWCAFVNYNKFGVGIYMPNADEYVASRGRKSNNYFSEQENKKYHPGFFTFGEDEITPSYASINYNYVNPCLHRKMIDFVPLEYSYALFIGDTDEMSQVFDGLAPLNLNAHLTDPTQGWPAKN
ncbi:MAG: hypothetical protein IKA61_01185 [Clostridia bacterium]|nr:hypothetical protein [Clostridia bacterium]